MLSGIAKTTIICYKSRMKIRIEDIIDLEYFISIDETLESRSDMESLAVRDREIFSRCKNRTHAPKELLLSWLELRKKQFLKNQDKRTKPLLPGEVFSSFYKGMFYLMLLLGAVFGITMVYSFLTYYGIHPINVLVFVFLFVLLPMVFTAAAFIVGVKKFFFDPGKKDLYHPPILTGLITALFLTWIPVVLKKYRANVFAGAADSMEFMAEAFETQKKEFHFLFFWPVYILTSVFASGFSAAVIAGTFFKVLVTDLAFGWQSTLVSGSSAIHDIVSTMAVFWRWLLPEGIGYPGIDQIEGSRIILKDGIHAMATTDLVSWWPFLCMSVICYSLIPRIFLMIAGIWARSYQTSHFDFEKPRFKQILLRMQSPVLDIKDEKEEVEDPSAKMAEIQVPSHDLKLKAAMLNSRACLLIAGDVFGEDAINRIIRHLKANLFLDVEQIISICHDFEKDAAKLAQIAQSGSGQAVLIFEVWQPPIRGVLFYIQKLKSYLPEKVNLYILLTQDAGQQDLSVDSSDINFMIWEKAVSGLGYQDIIVRRFV